MDCSAIFNIIGLVINTVASFMLLASYLKVTKNLDDDYVIDHDPKNGTYTQKKHLRDRSLGLIAFTLYTIGFILQLIAILINK